MVTIENWLEEMLKNLQEPLQEPADSNDEVVSREISHLAVEYGHDNHAHDRL